MFTFVLNNRKMNIGILREEKVPADRRVPFSPVQCKQIIAAGRAQKPQQAQVGMNRPGGGTDTKKRVTTISWIPFKEMEHMYKDLNNFIQKANENHFGFGDIQITENAQFTEYPKGGFYDWHMD